MMINITSVDLVYGLLAAMFFFGVLPGLLLRLIVLMYPKGHPTRAELRGELNAVPRAERLVWVAEQIELAVCEGLPARYRQRVTRLSGDRDKPNPVTIEVQPAVAVSHGIALGAVKADGHATITAEGDIMTASGSAITSDGILANEVAGDPSPLLERPWPTVLHARPTPPSPDDEVDPGQQ